MKRNFLSKTFMRNHKFIRLKDVYFMITDEKEKRNEKGKIDKRKKKIHKRNFHTILYRSYFVHSR
jgi:hypothetical protein